jgi:decaprenylphospho-beta-D-erythro-pentofuranosid-2-ulose 2-reductase
LEARVPNIKINHILICGATSRIAQDVARLYAKLGARFTLVGRDQEKLNILKSDLLAIGAHTVELIVFDFANVTQIPQMVGSAARNSAFDIVLVAQGILGDAKTMHGDPDRATQLGLTNYLSAQAVCVAARTYLTSNASIVFFSSVAGDRARRSNYVYGATKSAMDFYLQGLRLDLEGHGVNVLSLKLGPVSTPMTANLEKLPFMVEPEYAAKKILKAIQQRRQLVYIPWVWRPIMWVIRCLPYFIFRRLNF